MVTAPPPMWQELNLGSNRVFGASGVIVAGGRDLLSLEHGDRSGQLLLTVDIFDGSGNHVAFLRRNAWAFHQDQYDVTTAPASLQLVEKSTGDVLFEAQVTSPHVVQVTRASLYTPDGELVEVAPDFVRFRGVTMSGNQFSGLNSVIRIEAGYISLG